MLCGVRLKRQDEDVGWNGKATLVEAVGVGLPWHIWPSFSTGNLVIKWAHPFTGSQ